MYRQRVCGAFGCPGEDVVGRSSGKEQCSSRATKELCLHSNPVLYVGAGQLYRHS